jgi:hypothetical protein
MGVIPGRDICSGTQLVSTVSPDALHRIVPSHGELPSSIALHGLLDILGKDIIQTTCLSGSRAVRNPPVIGVACVDFRLLLFNYSHANLTQMATIIICKSSSNFSTQQSASQWAGIRSNSRMDHAVTWLDLCLSLPYAFDD